MKINLSEMAGTIVNADHSDVLSAVSFKLMDEGASKIQFIIQPCIKPLLRDIPNARIFTRRKVSPLTFTCWYKKEKKWFGCYGIFPQLINQIKEMETIQYKFDIHRKDFYEYDKPKDQTEKRLIEIAELGMQEVGTADFGIPDIMSGLYIEKVWSYSEKDWNDYILYVKELIQKKIKK